MFHLSAIISLTSLLSLVSVASGYVTQSPQTLFRRIPIYPTATAQTYYSPQSSSLATTFGSQASSKNITTTAVPSGYPQKCPGCCLAGDPIACTGTKTWDGPSLSLSDQCVLWDNACSGDITAAMQNFFANEYMLEEKPCWRNSNTASLHCAQYEPAETLSAMSKIKSWMRGTECFSKSIEVNGPDTTTITTTFTTAAHNAINSTITSTIITTLAPDPGETCCGDPIIEAQNVDIYYWPEPDANTACLSIIGNSVNPLLYGATTGAGPAYWGCTAIDPKTSTSTSYLDPTGTIMDQYTIMTIVDSIIRTAQITTAGALTFKQPLVNPWSPLPCIGQNSALPSSTVSVVFPGVQASVHARGHSLVIPQSMTQEDGLPVSTILSGTFTFTSPSIYANFHSIVAADDCGARGAEATITETMLAFSVGELSTIAGPLYDPIGSSFRNYSTKVFNFADLPCPPQTVMEENWYLPSAGEPYRPLIALPNKIRELDPEYVSCSDAFFTAYDPPRTLVLSAAMVPDVVTGQTTTFSVSATPGPTLDIGASKTAKDNEPPLTSVQFQTALRPSKTTNPVSDLGNGVSDNSPHANDPTTQRTAPEQQGDGYQSSVNDLNQPASAPGDPRQTLQPSELGIAKQTSQALSGLDPEQLIPHQMSRIESALAPSPQVHPTLAQIQESIYIKSRPPPGSLQTSGGTPPVGGSSEPQDSSYWSSYPSGEPNPQGVIYPSPSVVHLSIAGTLITINSSGDPIDSTKVNLGGMTETSIGVGAISQSNVITDGYQTAQLSAPARAFATTIAGHEIQVLQNGVSIHGNTITAGAAPTSISGTPVSVDSSNQIYLGGTRYQLLTPSQAPATTLANGAVAVPLWIGVSIDGTILTAGASAITIAGTAISPDTSDVLFFGSSPNSILTPPNFLTSGTSVAGQAISIYSAIDRATAAVTTMLEKAEATLSRGAPAVTVDGLPVAMDSAGGLVMGSETLALASSSGGLGALIMGGLQSGGPSSTEPTSNAGASSATAASIPSASPSIGHTVKGSAESMKNQIAWKLVAIAVSLTTICLHS